MSKKAFTLIEILVVIGVLAILMVTVGGIMTMSFKAKNSTESNESMSSKAVFILGELKRNILDADINKITCPVSIGNSISFATKSGGSTTLLCDEATAQIASNSASGNYTFLDNGVGVKNCQDFVWCELSAEQKVISIGFTLNLTVGKGSVGNSGFFYGMVAPRE